MTKPSKKPELAITTEEAASQLGPYPILGVLLELGYPLTRANYLALSIPGQNPRRQMHPEAELELPPKLRIGFGPE